jgi:hypothetical protein
MHKPLTLLLSWTVVVVVANRLVPDPGLWFDPAALAYVVVLPLLIGLATAGPGQLAEAFRDGLSMRPADLPAERRAAAASILHSMGGTAVAAGLLGFFGMLITTFNGIASSDGQATPGNLLGEVPSMVLAPLYGLALKTFLFDPLGQGLEEFESGLGADLEG